MERIMKRCDDNNNYEVNQKGDKCRCFIAQTAESNSDVSDDDSVTYAEMKIVSRANSENESITELEDKTVSSTEHDDSQRSDTKPSQSYIALIAMAILSTSERKMVLSDIYRYIIENYPFYKTQDKSWRNSIRHNLSLNDCFIKAGRSMNGKGNYWAIHPSNEEDFSKGDFRRRRTRRKIKRNAYPLGLYSELFRPYYAAATKYRNDYRALAQMWSCRPRAKSDESYGKPVSPMRPLPQKNLQPKPKKSFTIDSILGKDNENAEERNQQSKAYIPRRHFSWTSPSFGRSHSPRFDNYGSPYSPVYSHFTFDAHAAYPTSESGVMSPHLRDTIRDFSRLRAYSLR